jgi:hypothetical protein
MHQLPLALTHLNFKHAALSSVECTCLHGDSCGCIPHVRSDRGTFLRVFTTSAELYLLTYHVAVAKREDVARDVYFPISYDDRKRCKYS